LYLPVSRTIFFFRGAKMALVLLSAIEHQPDSSTLTHSPHFNPSPYTSTMSTDTLTALNNILQAEQESSDALEQLLETFNSLPEETLGTVSTQLWVASRDGITSSPFQESSPS